MSLIHPWTMDPGLPLPLGDCENPPRVHSVRISLKSCSHIFWGHVQRRPGSHGERLLENVLKHSPPPPAPTAEPFVLGSAAELDS